MNTERFWRLWDAGGTRSRPLPSIRLDLGRCVPAWALRLVAAGLAVGCGALLASSPGHLVVAVLVALLVAVAPHTGVAAAVVPVAVFVLSGTPDGFDARVFPLLLGSHVIVEASRLATSTSWDGLVELAVLRGELPAFLAVQGVAQGAALVAALVAGSSATATWPGVGALALLTAVAWAGLRQVRRPA